LSHLDIWQFRAPFVVIHHLCRTQNTHTQTCRYHVEVPSDQSSNSALP